jgi:separase
MPLDGEPEDHWKIMDSLLQDGCSILRHFGEDSGTGRPLPPDLPQPLVKLSNAYWAVHLQLKSSDAQEKLVTQAMRRSVELIQARPRSEQESGLLVMKLERLAETLEGQDRIQSARDALLRCVQLLIDFGTLQDAVDLAKTRPLQHVFDSTDRTATLGRLLKTYHRSFLKSGVASASEDAFFDSEEISLAGRGLLLEWQLSLFLKLLSKNRAWDTNLNSSVQKISERLQDIYTVDRFPIRRRRVQILLLQLSQNHPEILPDSMRQTDVDGTSKDVTKGTEDQGLKRYESHLQALWKLKSSMQHSTLNDVVVHECCSAWQSILGSVTSWNNLSEFVDDIELWLAELQTAMDYLAARGEEYICLPLLHQLTKALELEGSSDPSQLVAALCILALQLQRLGYSEKASAVLDKAEPLVTNKDVSTDAKLQWHIAFADYLVQTGDTDKCETHLSAAEDIARADQEFMDLAKPTTTLSGRVRFNRVLADACYVRSLVSEKLGHHKEAARYAKQCVILNRRIWAALESRSTPASAPPAANSSTDGSKAAFDPLSSLRDSKGAPLVTSLTHETLNGPRFWPLIPRLYQGLMQQSHVFANQGLLQEAVHVAEQAEKVAAAVSARSLLVENASRRAEYWAYSGRVDKAQKALQLPDEYLVQKHVCLVAYHLASASISHLTAEFQDESAAYGAIESLLKELRSPSFMKKFMTSSIGLEDLAEKLASVTLEAADAKKKPPTRAVRGRKPVSKPVPKAAPKAAPRKRKAAATSVPAEKPPAEVASEAGSVLSTLQAEALRRRALMHLAQEEIAKAFDLLNQAQVIELNAESNVSHQWVSYKATLLQSMSQLAADFTFNTLPESTIAFPAVRVKDRTASEGSAKRPTISPATIAKGARGKKASKTNFVATLREARERLIETHILCAQVGSTYSFQQASLALAQVTVLLSAVSGADLRGSLHPLYAAYMSGKYHISVIIIS